MSLNCRVFRDEKGQIDFVNAPNGNRSKLFDRLVDITGGNKNTALNIYALTETEDLKDAVKAKINSFKNRFANMVRIAPSDIRFSIVGEKGAANLDLLENDTVRIDNLEVAIEMGNSGENPQKIKIATGWEKGADGRWKYELDSSKASLNFNIDSMNKLGKKYSLKSILKYPELFKAYPELKDVKISISPKGGTTTEGFFNGKEIVLGIESNKLKDFFEIKSKLEKYKKLDPEVLRIINKNLEIDSYEESLRASGMSYSEASDKALEKYPYEERDKDYKTLSNFGYAKIVKSDIPGYDFLAPSDSFRQILRDFKKGSDKALEKSDFNNLNEVLLPVTLHEIQHWIQKKEGFAKGANTVGIYSYLTEEEKSEYKALTEAKKKAQEELAKEGKKWYDAPKEVSDVIFAPGTYLYQKYRSAMGEEEARNVEKRLKMTPRERLYSMLQDTEDLARENQIFIPQKDQVSFNQLQPSQKEVVQQITDRLVQSGLAKNVYQMSNSEIEAKLVELGVSPEIAKQVTLSDSDIVSADYNSEEDYWEVYFQDGSYLEVYLSEDSTKDEVKKEAMLLVKEYLLDSMPLVYRGINGEFSPNYKGVQYFAVNKRYAGVFGRNIEEFRIKSTDILDLDDWNKKWGVEKVDFGQGLLTVHQDNLSNLKEWRTRIKNSLFAVGVKVSKEELDSFMKEVEDAKIIKGEDIGNIGQIVFAVKDKSLVEPINKDIQFSKDLAKVGAKLNTAGFTYQGDVYLNTETMGLDTPIHEFGHLHLDWLKENRTDLYQAGLSLIEKNKEEAQQYINTVKETQPDLKEGTEKFNNEVLAQVIGDQGARLVNSKKDNSIADWLKNVWEAIRDILGLSNYTAEQVANMTLAEFGTASAAEMLSGSNIQRSIEENNVYLRYKYDNNQAVRENIDNKVSEYLNRINAIKEKEPSNYWSVDVPTEEVVRDAVINDRLVEVPGGMGIVTEDGNMIGLFKDKADAKNVARDLQMMRVEKGGIKMDNYDGYLTKIYQKNGFRVVSRLAFNEEYAPEDWDKEKHGTPDVVFMIYDPNNALNIEEKSFTKKQYDKASNYRDSFVEEAKKVHPYYLNKLSENKTGKTQSFFSDVVRGDSEKYKAKKQWVPLLKYTKEQNDFNSFYSKFKGNFDNHIATSIPTFRETQVKVGTALVKMFGEKGGLIYDIGGSEGGFVKAITESTKGKVKSINLDVNEDMGEAHKKTPVEGSSFINEAFYEEYQDEDTGKVYPKHIPKNKADVVHESMVFQFITPERKQFIKEVKDNYLKNDGILLLEEKLVPESDQEWLQNEYIKDQYKLQYYSQEEISGKAEEVLAGMRKNQTSVKDLQDALSSNFKYVEQYWDSGNFKGFVATNNIESLNRFRENFGENVVFKGEAPEALKSERVPSLELNGTKIFAKERVNPISGEKLDGIEWELIESTERGKGNARKAAEVFLNSTDAQGKDVYLTISPRDTQTSPERLESFYSSLGFEKVSDFEMVRKAKPVTPKDIDSNGEVSVKTLMDFSNSKVKPLTKEGLKAAKNTAMALKVKSSQELIEKMDKALIKNGVVLFDKLSLQRSKLYNIFEINTILSSPKLQKQIKESLLALKNSEPFVVDYNENFVIPQGREINQFGKQEVINPNIAEKDLIESVAGVKEDEIQDVLPAAFSNKYYTDSNFKETVDSIAREYKKVPVKDIVEGELVDKTEDVKGMLSNTLTDDYNEDLIKDIQFLRRDIDKEIFNSNLTRVSKVLNKIKKNAYINGIDLRNFPTLALTLTRDEIINFLDLMEGTLSDPYNVEAFEKFSEVYFELLGDKDIKTEVVKTTSNNDIFIEEPLSEYEMFSKFGLVKKQDSIYRKVTDTPLDTLYENFFEHKNLLPEGVDSLDSLKDYVQKNASVLEVSDYEVDVDNLEKIFLYKKFFGFPISTIKPRVNTEGFNKITNTEDYLTDDFVREFNKWLLYTNNTYFKVTSKGIELTQKDELSKSEAVDSVPVRFRQALAEYNIISNNLNLDLPLEEEKYTDVNTQYEERQKVVNNPERVKKITGQYSYLKDGVLAVKNEGATFVRTPIGVFEKIFEFANVKFYGKLDTTTNKGYKKIVAEAPYSDINFNSYNYLETTPEAFKESKNYYSRKELDDINKEYFACQ